MDRVNQVADDFLFVAGAENESVAFIHRLSGVFTRLAKDAQDRIDGAVKNEHANQKRQAGEDKVEPTLSVGGIILNQIQSERVFDVVNNPIPKFHNENLKIIRDSLSLFYVKKNETLCCGALQRNVSFH